MPPSIERIRPAAPEEWDSVWSSCGYATYFHSREWAELWEQATSGRMRPTPSVLEFDDGKAALLPLSTRSRFGGRVQTFVSSPAWTYGGWISKHELGVDHASTLSRHLLESHGDLFWKLNPFDSTATELQLDTSDADETQAIDLDDGFDELLRRWTKGHRAAASQAERLGVEVRVAASMDDWRTYFEVYRESLRRWGDAALSRFGWELFGAMSEAQSENIRLWLAEEKGRVVAGALCLHAPHHVVYWHGAALSEAFELRPVHLLIREILRDSCETNALRWFDFNPSGPLDGVRAFKKGFGPRVLACPNLRRESTWLRLGRKLEAGIHKLIRR